MKMDLLAKVALALLVLNLSACANPHLSPIQKPPTPNLRHSLTQHYPQVSRTYLSPTMELCLASIVRLSALNRTLLAVIMAYKKIWFVVTTGIAKMVLLPLKIATQFFRWSTYAFGVVIFYLYPHLLATWV